jgi:bla regulator protein blaR1
MVNEDNSRCFISSTQLFKALNFKGWQEKKVSSHYEFSPSITVCINNGTGYKIKFYKSEPKLAMVLYGDKYRYYTLPKDNYSNLYIMCMASSYYIPKEVVELVTSYKKVNFESSSEFSYVEKHTNFSIRNECYSIYEKNGKYYCENANKDINEILEDVYYRGLKAVEKYGFTMEYEENK